ncbi:DEAD/DEAH box helicase [Rhodococcus kronopolitis]|uniref:DEAD/DEAH box helicase n=1 Tax=Rhodococcus kronopolitis TaxID=1460226 RepID=A0ABV9FX88_9NOCA
MDALYSPVSHPYVSPREDKLPMTELRAWQTDALARWHANGRRGIIAAATGTGKTRMAIEAIRLALDDGARAVVVVPTRVLQQQWIRALRTAGIVGRRLGTIGGTSPDPNPDHLILVAVIDSARNGVGSLFRHWTSSGRPTLLVVDECHWSGSAHNRGVFDGDPAWRLGLSATPERGDDGFDDVLVPMLGEVVYRYSMRNAMDDGVLSDLRLSNLLIDLPQLEQSEYDRIEAQITASAATLTRQHPELFTSADWTAHIAQAASTIPAAKRLNSLVVERRRLLANNNGRLRAMEYLLDLGVLTSRRTILFNETINQAEHVAQKVRELGIKVSIDHSRLNSRERDQNQEAFRAGATDAMVAVRTADEGLDIPDADQAIIVSGTMNPRQRIQRLGRVVRLGGTPPRAISLLARGTLEESVIAGRDRELLGLDRVIIKPLSAFRDDSVDFLFSV